jgi:hypothetical protein
MSDPQGRSPDGASPAGAAPVGSSSSTSSAAALALRQFSALLRKNATLVLRSRRTPLGVGGAVGLLLQVLLPALFFCLMWIPKHYIQPIHHPVFLEKEVYDLDSKFWAGPSPYEGWSWLLLISWPYMACTGKASTGGSMYKVDETS